jgi:hypothetical protein
VERLTTRLRGALSGLPPVYWALLAGMFVNRLASFVATFLGLYLVRARGFGEEQAAPVVALFGLGVLVGAPVGGVLADAVGRRATMLLSFATGALAVGALGFVSSPPALAALTFVAAATSELYRPAMNAAIADVVPPPDRARAWGLSYWAMNLGWVFGLALGGFLAARSYRALFLADAATTLAFAAIVLRRVPETRPPGTRAHSPLAGLGLVLRDRPFVVFLLLHLLALTVFVQFQFALPLDMKAHGLGEPVFALVMVANGLGMTLLPELSIKLECRHDDERRQPRLPGTRRWQLRGVRCHVGRRTVAIQCRLGHLGATDHVFGRRTAIRRAVGRLGRRRRRDWRTTHCRSRVGLRRAHATTDRVLIERHGRPATIARTSGRESTSGEGVRGKPSARRTRPRGVHRTLWWVSRRRRSVRRLARLLPWPISQLQRRQR